ncbi:MAG: hypothetical protein ABI047_08050 [Jatrophihabitantaceae bacterium]
MNLYHADEFDTIDAAFPWLFGGFLVVFGVALIVIVSVWVRMALIVARNRRVLRQSGVDPTTVGSQLAVRFLGGRSME